MKKTSEGIKFFEETVKSWVGEYKKDSFKKRFNIFTNLLKKYQNENDTWLDLGCGSGVLTTVISKKAKYVLAVDGSQLMINEAKKNTNSLKNVSIKCSDILEIEKVVNFPLDGILCSSVLEYTEQPYKILESYLRLLKSGGTFILSVPPTLSFTRKIFKMINVVGRFFGKSFFPYIKYSKFEFDLNMLKKFLHNDCKIIEIYNFDHYLPKILLKIFRPSLKIFVIKKL